MNMIVKKGDIFWVDLNQGIGAEQGGVRPVVIIQNDVGNKYSPTVVAAAVTSQINKAKLPTHVEVSSEEYGLNKDSVILLEHARVLDKRRLLEKIGHINNEDMIKIDKALAIQFGLGSSASSNSEINDINEAINILKGIAKKYGIKEYDDKKVIEENYRKVSKEAWQEIYGEMTESIANNINTTIKPVVTKLNIAKGMLVEHAVIGYFKKNKYVAHETGKGSKLDHLQIDVIAKNDTYKIFVQVKKGQIGAQEIGKLVQNVINLPNEYDEENLKRVAGIIADTFPPDSDMLRMGLEGLYKIPIIFIHKYQILKVCPEYKSTVK